MLNSRQNSDQDIESVTEVFCEQYLPRVFQYVHYWVNDTKIAEELTLKAVKKALIRYRRCCGDEKKFSAGIFASARREIQDSLKANDARPILPGLSTQEQEVLSLKFGAVLNNRMISKLLGLSELKTGRIVYQSLCKLKG